MKRIILVVVAAMFCTTLFAQEADNTKTGILLNNQHKVVVEARRSAMHFYEIEVS